MKNVFEIEGETLNGIKNRKIVEDDRIKKEEIHVNCCISSRKLKQIVEEIKKEVQHKKVVHVYENESKVSSKKDEEVFV